MGNGTSEQHSRPLHADNMILMMIFSNRFIILDRIGRTAVKIMFAENLQKLKKLSENNIDLSIITDDDSIYYFMVIMFSSRIFIPL